MQHPAISVITEPTALADALSFLMNSSGHEIHEVDVRKVPAKLKKTVAAMLALIKHYGFEAKDKDSLLMSNLKMVSGKAERNILTGHVALKDYKYVTVRYVMEKEEVLEKSIHFSGEKNKFLHIELETLGQPYIVGSNALLGNWTEQEALPLQLIPGRSAAYEIAIPLLDDEEVTFKFIKKEPSGTVWESGDDRTAGASDDDVYIRDSFRH